MKPHHLSTSDRAMYMRVDAGFVSHRKGGTWVPGYMGTLLGIVCARIMRRLFCFLGPGGSLWFLVCGDCGLQADGFGMGIDGLMYVCVCVCVCMFVGGCG